MSALLTLALAIAHQADQQFVQLICAVETVKTFPTCALCRSRMHVEAVSAFVNYFIEKFINFKFLIFRIHSEPLWLLLENKGFAVTLHALFYLRKDTIVKINKLDVRNKIPSHFLSLNYLKKNYSQSNDCELSETVIGICFLFGSYSTLSTVLTRL